MTAQLIKSNGLSETQYTQIRQLEEICNRFDGLSMKLNLNTLRHRPEEEINDYLYYAGDQLIGFLALYSFNNQEVEVSAMTHPNHRRQGVFRQLLTAAREEVRPRQVPDFLFIAERASAAARPVMDAIGAAYEFSEYKMTLQGAKTPANVVSDVELRPATPQDLDKLIEIDAKSFGIEPDATRRRLLADFSDANRRIWVAARAGEIIGKIHASTTEGETFITAFSVLPEHRGQGYGKTMLSHIVQLLVAEQHPIISLEVETENENALSLYKNVGFQIETAYDYYRLPVDG